MKVGRSHHWNYPDGVWVERKVSPDKWAIRFTSHKRRKGAGAPAGSGAAVGAEYHWFIVAHQRARKADANTYETEMVGAKHMVAFRQPGWERWSSRFKGHKSQKQRLVRLLQEALAAVRSAPDVQEGNDLIELPGMDASKAEWPAKMPGALPSGQHGPQRSRERPRRPSRGGTRTHGKVAKRTQARPAR